jgi:hypothetical protein
MSLTVAQTDTPAEAREASGESAAGDTLPGVTAVFKTR